MAAKSKNVDVKSRRCPHCQGTELVGGWSVKGYKTFLLNGEDGE